MTDISVPYFLPNVFLGAFGKLHGLARYTEGILRLEFQVRLLFRGDVETLDLPVAQIEEVVYTKKWGGGTLTVRPTTLRAIEGFPVLEDGEMKLHLNKQYRDDAKLLVSEVELAISQHRLEEARRGAADNA